MSSSAEHDSSKFTNRNGQGDYFVASSTYIHTYRGSNKREAKVRDQERVSERERENKRRGEDRKEVFNRMCAYVLSALCVHRNCGKTSTLGNTKRKSALSILIYVCSAVL